MIRQYFNRDGLLASWARQKETAVLQPLVRYLARCGITPNSLSILGLTLCAIAALLVSQGEIRTAGVLWFLGSACDVVDGELARHTGIMSAHGAFLDSVLDHCGDSLLAIGLIWMFLHDGSRMAVILVVLALATSLLSSHIRSRARMLGFLCNAGLATRAERALLLVAGMVTQYLVVALWVLVVVNTVTCVQRFVIAWRCRVPLIPISQDATDPREESAG